MIRSEPEPAIAHSPLVALCQESPEDRARFRFSLTGAVALHVLLCAGVYLLFAWRSTDAPSKGPMRQIAVDGWTMDQETVAPAPPVPPGGNGTEEDAHHLTTMRPGSPASNPQSTRPKVPVRPLRPAANPEAPSRQGNANAAQAHATSRDAKHSERFDAGVGEAVPGAKTAEADAGAGAAAPAKTDAEADPPFSLMALLESRAGAKYDRGRGDSGIAGPGGSHGGPGGWGIGTERVAAFAPIVTETSVFGGRTPGAFVGIVCAIPPISGLSSIRDCGQPIAKLFTNQIDIAPRNFTEGFPGLSGRTEWFAVEYRGTIRTTREGKYQFRVLSDDGARLVVDGELVVDNDGQHPPTSRRGETWLPAATHPVRIDYYQGPRYSIALQVWVTPPGERERLLGPVL